MLTTPGPIGLYDPRFEHDSCGVSFVAHMKGHRSHELVRTGLLALTNLEHRGATGAEPDTGDGAGILLQVPDRLLRGSVDFELPAEGSYAAGVVFLPAADGARDKAQAQIESIMADEGLTVLGWRDVPVDPDCLGKTSRAVMPTFRQLFVSSPGGEAGVDLDRRTYVARKRTEHELTGELDSYFSSLSSRTIVYKGMLTTPQLSEFFLDLTDERIESALLLVHSRFSTNTFPSWPLAHPYRYVAHNGEINTVQGNQNWMRAREAMAASDESARPAAGVPDLHARGLRHGSVRRGARAVAPRWPTAAPRRVDDDPRGVGEQRRDGRRSACLLPVPCQRDGAVGWPGQRHLHRR